MMVSSLPPKSSPNLRDCVLVEDCDGFFIADARERGLHVFELGRVALEGFELARFIFQNALYDGADEAFARDMASSNST